MKPIHTLLLSFLFSLQSIATPIKENAWIDPKHPLIVEWTSFEVEGFGTGNTVLHFKINKDGTMKSSMLHSDKEKNGEISKHKEELNGLYAIGANHIYFWSNGPPKGFKTDKPHNHIQSRLLTYKFEGSNLVLKMVKGGSKNRVIKLKKQKTKNADK